MSRLVEKTLAGGGPPYEATHTPLLPPIAMGSDFAETTSFPRQTSLSGPENLAFKFGGTRIHGAERRARRAAQAQNGLPVPGRRGSSRASPNLGGMLDHGGLSCGFLLSSESC